MTLTPYVPSYWTSRNPAYAVNPNPVFVDYATTPGYPGSWASVSGATPTRQQPGVYGPNAVRLVGGAGADAAMKPSSPLAMARGWYVVEATAALVSGALTGAGVEVKGYTDSGLGTNTETQQVVFATAADVNGTVQGAGTPGTTYQWRVLKQLRLPTTTVIVPTAASHLSSLGSTAGANSLDWSAAWVRAATIGEIAGGNQVAGLPVMPLFPGRTAEPVRSPMWNTAVKESTSGRTRTTPLWSSPRWLFDLAYDVVRARVTNDEIAGLLEFFDTVQGRNGVFLYLDEDDYTVSGDQFGTGDGSTTAFQLCKKRRTYAEPIYAPFGYTIYKAGVLQTETTDYVIGSDGVITFTSAPAGGAALTWYGYFYFKCRLEDDKADLARIMDSLFGTGLKFKSQKP